MREDRQWATTIIWNKKPNHKQGIVSKRDTFKMEVHLSKNNMTRAHCLVIICFSPLKITEKAIFPSIILSSKKSMTILQKDLLAWLQNYECSLCALRNCTGTPFWASAQAWWNARHSRRVDFSICHCLAYYSYKFEAHILSWLAIIVNPLVGIQFIQEGKGRSACYEYRVHI